MERYEENKAIGAFWGWAFVFLLTASVIGWCMFLMMAVEDPPREWDFGALPEVPAQSIYSTLKPPPANFTFPLRLRTPPSATKDLPQQMPPLPEGIPWKPPSDEPPDAPDTSTLQGGTP